MVKLRKLNNIEHSEKFGVKLANDCEKLWPCGLIFVGLVVVLIYKKRGQKEMKEIKKRQVIEKSVIEAERYLAPIEEAVMEHDPANLKMNKFEEEEFVNRIKGMSREELEIVADILPIELCMARIQKELDKAKRVEDYIRGTINMFE